MGCVLALCCSRKVRKQRGALTMADYYALIMKAAEGLQNAEDRRRLYERGRTALTAELRAFKPPLRETAITKEQLAFEEAIGKVEAEVSRRYSCSE
jgi:hypothetical protein